MSAEFKSPYREVGLVAQRALKAKQGKKPEWSRGIARDFRAGRAKDKKKAGKCRCGAPKAADSEWCAFCHGGSFTAPKFASERKNWRRQAVTAP